MNDKSAPKGALETPAKKSTTSVAVDTTKSMSSTSAAVHGPRTVKRARRTRVALHEIDDAIVTAVEIENPVSLRGVYYRVVSAGAVDKTEQGYRLVQRQLVKLREDGVVPYSWITDGTRLMRRARTYADLQHGLTSFRDTYLRDLWTDSDYQVIVLSEKDAITGTVVPVTDRLHVELGIARGYSSITFAHSIAETIADNTAFGKTTVVYQLGDHDPSGVDAWRAFQATVMRFVPDADVVFERLAVTPQQIEMFDLPTRPTKTSDSRSASFVGGSVEVDAIAPTVLRDIVETAVMRYLDDSTVHETEFYETIDLLQIDRLIGGAA